MFEAQLKMSNKLDPEIAIFLKNRNSKWISMVTKLVEQHPGQRIRVFDASRLNHNLGSIELGVTDQDLKDYFEGLGVEFSSLSPEKAKLTILRKGIKWSAELHSRAQANITSSIQGIRNEAPIIRILWASRQYAAWQSIVKNSGSISSALSGAARVYIPNGRDIWALELAKMLEEKENTEVFYFESMGWLGATRMVNFQFPTHSRLALQEDALKSPQQVTEGVASQWLKKRLDSTDYVFDENGPLPQKKYALFATSTFEYEFLPKEWNCFPYRDQFDGFGAFLDLYDKTGANSLLRIHPNQSNSSLRSQLAMTKKVRQLLRRFPGLSVLWHFDNADSYRILDSCSVIVVSSSTIGFEAAILGKHVSRVGTSMYDSVARVPHFQEEQASEKLDPIRLDMFLSYLFQNSLEVEEIDLAPDQIRAFRIARLLRESWFWGSLELFFRVKRVISPKLGVALSKTWVTFFERPRN